MKFSIEKLDDYAKKGLLFKQVHPFLPLTIWNYSPEVQYSQLWDDVTLSCRGLVTDENGGVVAKPFPKFFNIEENRHTPTQDFEVFEKMDGSLGIMFKYRGEMICATRGSFTSDQAKWMMKYAKEYNYGDIIVDGFTYLFELIYPENRIVVDYGEQERMVLLAIINTENGEEVLHNDLFRGFDVVKKYDGINDYKELRSTIANNAEGFVVRFSNGSRMKIKSEEYIRLHKIMTNLSNIAIWEALSNNTDIKDLLINVPDEFYNKVKSYVKDLRYSFMSIKEHAGKLYDNYMENLDYNTISKKHFAEFTKNQPKHLHDILYKMYDRKKYDSIIWKLLKPKYKKL